MNTREAIDVAFIAAVAVILVAAFIYVNLPGDEEVEGEEGTEEVTEGGDAPTDGGSDTVAAPEPTEPAVGSQEQPLP